MLELLRRTSTTRTPEEPSVIPIGSKALLLQLGQGRIHRVVSNLQGSKHEDEGEVNGAQEMILTQFPQLKDIGKFITYPGRESGRLIHGESSIYTVSRFSIYTEVYHRLYHVEYEAAQEEQRRYISAATCTVVPGRPASFGVNEYTDENINKPVPVPCGSAEYETAAAILLYAVAGRTEEITDPFVLRDIAEVAFPGNKFDLNLASIYSKDANPNFHVRT
jgi:hypothetical protein